MQHSSFNKFLEAEQQGNKRVLFDKLGVTQPPAYDPGALHKKLRKRLQQMKVVFNLCQLETTKERNRGNNIEAISYYYASIIRPLVELLRIRHMSVPARHEFYTSYIHYDLPKDVLDMLGELFYVCDPADLDAKFQQAKDWFQQVMRELSAGDYA